MINKDLIIVVGGMTFGI